MATIGNDSNGRKRILFVDGDGKRRTLRLGKGTRHWAEQIRTHVEALVISKLLGLPPERQTAAWLAGVGDAFHRRLAAVGLVQPKATPGMVSLAAFINEYLTQRQSDVKAGTMLVMKSSRNKLVAFMGELKAVAAVTPADADAFRASLFADKKARATVNKACYYARHYFTIAQRRNLIASNPFAHVHGAVRGNQARRVFVPAADVDKVITVAPDPEWKLLIALARYGGVRMPSEALALTWHDVDFAGKRFIVRSSKTEHHTDGGVRVVPMFPELVPLFQAVFDQAQEGTVHVITRYRDAGQNLRTQFKRYIEAAGLVPWPKLFQNLRASRATELADKFPSHVCAAWLGHTERVADEHYRSVTDQHFDRATATIDSAAQNPAQQPTETACNGTHVEGATGEKPAVCGQKQGIAIPCKTGTGSARIRTENQEIMSLLL